MPSSRLLHRTLSSLALFGVGVVVGWLFFGAQPAPRKGPDDTRAEPVSSAEPATPVLQGRRPVEPRSELVVAPAPGSSAAPGVAPPTPSGVAGRIEVTLERPERFGRPDCRVYALPAGAPGVPELTWAPHAEELLGESVVLSLPRAGLWDVFFTSKSTAGAVLDVDVAPGATVPVPLAPYPSAPIRFRLEEDLPEGWPADWAPVAEVRAPPTSERIDFPGRNGQAPLRAAASFDAHGEAATPPLPAGRMFHVEVLPVRYIVEDRGRKRRVEPRGGPFALVPATSTTQAGETVDVRVLRRGAVRLHVRLDRAPPASWAQVARLGLRIQVEAEGGEGDHRWVQVTPDATPPVAPSPVLWGDPGPARVTWKRAGFLPGATEPFRLEPGVTIDCEAVLEIDPAFTPGESRRTRPPARVRVEVEGWTEPVGGFDLVLFGLSKQADGALVCHDTELDHYPLVATFHREILPVEEVWAIRVPDLVSPKTRVPSEGPLRVELEPGGHLMVALDRILPPGMGALVLRRSDGLPFPVLATIGPGEAPGLAGVGCRLVVEPGWLVGPLAEGEHRFEVTLGGARLPDVTAHVRAGRIEVLRIRR